MRGLWVAIVAATWVGLSGSASLADPVVVELMDGRVVQGEIDARTDSATLWIRRESVGIQLVSGFDWRRVRSLSVAGAIVPDAEWPRWIAAQASPAKKWIEIAPSPAPPPALPLGNALPFAGEQARRIESLQIQSQLANWDGDLRMDGLQVAVAPIDGNGRIVPVDGVLDLTLTGLLEPTISAGGGVGPVAKELERVSYRLRPADFANGPARVRLPFRLSDPERDVHLAREAVLHARFGATGHGVFEASEGDVVLRAFSRARDQLQLRAGERFVPNERRLELGN